MRSGVPGLELQASDKGVESIHGCVSPSSLLTPVLFVKEISDGERTGMADIGSQSPWARYHEWSVTLN